MTTDKQSRSRVAGLRCRDKSYQILESIGVSRTERPEVTGELRRLRRKSARCPA